MGFTIDIDGSWSRAQDEHLAGQSVGVLASANPIVHMGLHTSTRQRLHTGLRDLIGLAESLRHFMSMVDWQRVPGHSKDWGVSRLVRLALRLASDLQGGPVKETWLDLLRPELPDEELVAAARRRVLAHLGSGELTPV